VPEGGAEAVFGTARQFPTENFLLVAETENDDRGMRRVKAGRAKYGPSANGVKRSITTRAKYMGWRTRR